MLSMHTEYDASCSPAMYPKQTSRGHHIFPVLHSQIHHPIFQSGKNNLPAGRFLHDETGQRADYFFLIEKWDDEFVNAEPEKCDDLDWFALDTLPENMMHHIRYALKAYQNGIAYSEIPFTREWVN